MDFNELWFITAYLIHKCDLMPLLCFFLLGRGQVSGPCIWIHISLKALSVAATLHWFSHRSSLELSDNSGNRSSIPIKSCYLWLSNCIVKRNLNGIEVALLWNAAPFHILSGHLSLFVVHLWIKLPCIAIMLFLGWSWFLDLCHFVSCNCIFIIWTFIVPDTTCAAFFNNILHKSYF